MSVVYQYGVRNVNESGNCKDFLTLNNRTTCCSPRNDECYSYHYDVRCYCDSFCHRAESQDCCSDAEFTCGYDFVRMGMYHRA